MDSNLFCCMKLVKLSFVFRNVLSGCCVLHLLGPFVLCQMFGMPPCLTDGCLIVMDQWSFLAGVHWRSGSPLFSFLLCFACAATSEVAAALIFFLCDGQDSVFEALKKRLSCVGGYPSYYALLLKFIVPDLWSQLRCTNHTCNLLEAIYANGKSLFYLGEH